MPYPFHTTEVQLVVSDGQRPIHQSAEGADVHCILNWTQEKNSQLKRLKYKTSNLKTYL